jgi:hypothetical protein
VTAARRHTRNARRLRDHASPPERAVLIAVLAITLGSLFPSDPNGVDVFY